MKTKEKKIAQSILIGDFDWNTTRNIMIYGMMRCKTEVDFTNFLLKIYNSMGTAKELAQRREKLRIHPFTEKDLDKIEKLENLEKKNDD